MEGGIVGGSGGDESIAGGMGALEDSPVVAIFVLGGREEDEDECAEHGEGKYGLTEARAFHAPKFGKTWGGKVIPKLGHEMAGLTQITSAFPLWDGGEKKFGPKFREVLLQVKTAHLHF